MRRYLIILLNCIVITALTLPFGGTLLAQGGDEDAFIASLLGSMSPEVRIGQLFIVAFDGNNTSEVSDVASFIDTYHIGGVILSANHGNIVDSGISTPLQVAQLSASLQQLAQTAATSVQPDGTALDFIPLFIAMEQDGGGAQYSEITSGLTPQPSAMAIGATWDRAHAEAVGQIVGSELSALGINLLIGPSLDLLTEPEVDGGDVGIRSFGGDPYWVSTLAGAFVRGLRAGSNGRMAVIAKHWPGEGGLKSDLDAINRSLDELQRIDLRPYFDLMQVGEDEVRPLVDAVLTTHARYRGFSGLRDSTDPISVDATALGTLLQHEEISRWREAGGVVVSGSLGDEALRRFYDPSGATFPYQQIALEAFLAGNDLLILDNFSSSGSSIEEAQNIRQTIQSFQGLYNEDLDFQDRVNDAVIRILRLKYRLYPDYIPTDVAIDVNAVNLLLRNGLPVIEGVAQNALTLLSQGDALPTVVSEDTFLIFTDDRPILDCNRCPLRSTLSTDAISQTLNQLGGVPPEQVVSWSFADLKAFLDGTQAAPDLSDAFEAADWIILAHQNLQTDVPRSGAARQLLRTRPELLTDKRVVLFSFGAPYEWTREDLNLVDAYYALYGISTPFVDAAVRTLFSDSEPRGASPVDVEAIGYDLIRQTEPDSEQVLGLFIDETPSIQGATPEPPNLRVGDVTRIRSEIIFDRNGNPVPDETPVQFTLQYLGVDGEEAVQIDTSTHDGWAFVDVEIEYIAVLEVRVQSEPALESTVLQLTITEEGPTTIQAIEPPTATATSTPSATPTPVPTQTPSPTPVAFVEQIFDPELRRVTVVDYVLALFGITLVGAWGYRGESKRKKEGAIDRAVHLVFWGSSSGLIAYTYYALGLPGADAVSEALGGWSALIVTLVGAVLPWLLSRLTRR